MAETKQQDGFIPAGLVVESLYGMIEGELGIAGEVDHVAFKAERLRIAEGGTMKDGQVEAGSVIIDGGVSGVTFITPRLTAGAGARISDCVIEMGSLTGCSIHEDASFEGDVRISVSRKGGQENAENHKGAKAAGKDPDKVEMERADAVGTVNRAQESGDIAAQDDAPDPHWPAQTPDISEAAQDADILLGG